MNCQATRQSDEMACARCRLRWDVDDPDPPLCGQKVATRDLGERLSSSEGFVSALAPVNPLLNPDYDTIRKKVTARFSKTLDYLAK